MALYLSFEVLKVLHSNKEWLITAQSRATCVMDGTDPSGTLFFQTLKALPKPKRNLLLFIESISSKSASDADNMLTSQWGYRKF